MYMYSYNNGEQEYYNVQNNSLYVSQVFPRICCLQDEKRQKQQLSAIVK
jgi:hypothetical protein